MTDKERAYQTVLVDCLAVSPGENVLVLTDPKRRAIGDDLVQGARELGAEAVLIEMAERENHGTEPPDLVATAMLECDVFIAPTTKSVSHTQARHAASEKGVRAATMPQITEDMLLRTMSADYEALRERSAILADLLTKGSSVTITSAAGTDVTFSIEGRDGLPDDGDLRTPGAFGNLPAGEGFIAPVEGKTQGRIVFDGSIWPIGILEKPLIADIEDGYATLSGPDSARLDEIFGKYGRDAYAVAELGIGTNEKAKLTGNTLEDEKILGTIHVAFGDNHSFGGTIRVASHQDGIVLEPTVMIDDKVVLEAGRLSVG